MEKIKRQNKLMFIGAMILLGALLLWTLGFEIYARTADKEETIAEDISLVTFHLDNTSLYMEETESDELSYTMTRSRNIEWKMYGKELRLTARGGILTVRIPDDMELQSINIENQKEPTYIYSVDAGELRIDTDGKLTLQDVDAERAKLDAANLEITSSEMDTLFISATDKVDITETDIDNLSMFFGDLDATVLGGNIGSVKASSRSGALEIEPENGISSITVTGGVSTIFIDGEDTASESFVDKDNPDGADIEFTSPKGSVKTC